MEHTPFDPTRRRLCPDGACIGVIGADGRCKVCGRSDDGRPVAAVGATVEPEPEHDDSDEHEAQRDDVDTAEAAGAEGKSASGGFDPKRRLCDDGTCIGVVGADNICSVCGRTSGG